uniref:Uncharacterized protein n=1 Tax=Anguilla anguilla TaxID=7936 RepID=A0A0E9SF11_ANGAN
MMFYIKTAQYTATHINKTNIQ